MSDLDLDAIEARANGAGDEPWIVVHEPAWEADGVQHPDVIKVGAPLYVGDDEPVTICLVSTDYEDDPVDVLGDAEFIAHARTDVPALVAALREARAEVERLTEQVRIHAVGASDNAARLAQWEADFPCDGACRDYPEETCSRHGRRPADLWDRSDQAFAERDDWRRRYEALRDGVLAWSFDPVTRENEDGTRSIIWPDKAELRAVVARVEGDES